MRLSDLRTRSMQIAKEHSRKIRSRISSRRGLGHSQSRPRPSVQAFTGQLSSGHSANICRACPGLRASILKRAFRPISPEVAMVLLRHLGSNHLRLKWRVVQPPAMFKALGVGALAALIAALIVQRLEWLWPSAPHAGEGVEATGVTMERPGAPRSALACNAPDHATSEPPGTRRNLSINAFPASSPGPSTGLTRSAIGMVSTLS